LKKAILWLKKKDFGFSFLLTLATAIALGFFSEYFPRQWESLSSISDPVENVGWHIGTMFFSGYAIRGSLSFYLVSGILSPTGGFCCVVAALVHSCSNLPPEADRSRRGAASGLGFG